MTTKIRSVFSDFVKKNNIPFQGNYLHAGVDLPLSGNTGFDLDGEPRQQGYMEQYESELGWHEEFCPACYKLPVIPRICGNDVDGLYSLISKAKLEEGSKHCTYSDCDLVIPLGHQWDACLRDKFGLPKDGIPVHLVVKGYKFVNRPELMPKGIIVSDAVCEAIKSATV